MPSVKERNFINSLYFDKLYKVCFYWRRRASEMKK